MVENKWNAKGSGRAASALSTLAALALAAAPAPAGTIALWLFDEPEGLYPSSDLNDASGHGLLLILGRGARIAEGRFGRALEPGAPEPLKISGTSINPQFGLLPMPDTRGPHGRSR